MFSSNRVVKNHWVLMSEDNASQVIWGVFVKTPQGGWLLFQFRLDTYPGAARASRPRLSLDRCLEQAWKETKVTSWKEQHKRSKQATKFFCWRYFFFFLSHKVPGQGLGDFKVCSELFGVVTWKTGQRPAPGVAEKHLLPINLLASSVEVRNKP